MFFNPFHDQIKSARLKRAMTQQVLAEKCGMLSRARLVQLERNYRTPNAQEKQKLSQVLNIAPSPTRRPEALRRLSNSGKRWRGEIKPYFPPQDRMTHIRFRAARYRYPKFVDKVVACLKRRSDFLDLAYLCSKIPCDSYAEVLFLLALLNSGATAAMLTISNLAWTPHRIVNPKNREDVNQRPQPCLILDDTAFFFQVAFLTPRLYIVDVLAWNGRWSFLEIDAEGHDFSTDLERTERIALPCTRNKPTEIVAPGYVETLKRHLSQHNQHRRAS